MAKTAREKRADAIEAREKTRDILKSGKNPKTGKKLSKSTEKKLEQRMLDQGARARVQGEKLRDESGRERGQSTRYIGPTGGATTWADERAVQARKDRDLPTPTIYQDVNRARMAEIEAKTTAQKRAAFKELWGDPGTQKYKDMQDWQAKEIAAGRYNKNLSLLDNLEDLLDLDDSKTRAAKMTGGSEYLATKYDRPGLLDWSDLAPPEMPGTLGTAPAQAALLERGLAAYQPWRRPGVGEAFKYQPPVGPTYATRASLLGGADVSSAAAAAEQQRLAAAAAEEERANQQLNNPLRVDPNQWEQPGFFSRYNEGRIDPVSQGLLGGGQTPFMQFTQQAHESLYPGRFGTWGLDAQGKPLGAAPAMSNMDFDAFNILSGFPSTKP